jgi:hypothetical protein
MNFTISARLRAHVALWIFFLLLVPSAFAFDSVTIFHHDGSSSKKTVVNGLLRIEEADTAVRLDRRSFDAITRLELVRTAYMTDFSFLTRMPNLERIDLFESGVADFQFLKHMPKLKLFWVESADLSKTSIDFSENSRLRTISITNSNLSDTSRLLNLPRDLTFLVLWYNGVKTANTLSKTGLPSVKVFLVDHNPPLRGLDLAFVTDSKLIPPELKGENGVLP